MLGVTFTAQWWTGIAGLDPGYERGDASWIKYVGDVFAAGNSYHALLWASMAGTLTAMGLAIGQRILSLADVTSAWVNGVRSMLMAILILTLAWALGDVCSTLDTKGFIVAALSDTLDPRLLPAIVFVLAAADGVLDGDVVGNDGHPDPARRAGGVHARPAGWASTMAITMRILLGSVSAVLAGAIFGDHCSPISDTTVLSSMASGCDHVDHVRTQLPYAIIVAVAAVLFGYLPAGYGMSPFIGPRARAAALFGWLRWRGRVVDRDARRATKGPVPAAHSRADRRREDRRGAPASGAGDALSVSRTGEPAALCTAGDFVTIRPASRPDPRQHGADAREVPRDGRRGGIHDPRQPVFVLDHDIQNDSPANRAKYARHRGVRRREHGIDFLSGRHRHRPSDDGRAALRRAGQLRGRVRLPREHVRRCRGRRHTGRAHGRRRDLGHGDVLVAGPAHRSRRARGRLPPGSTGKDVILALCGLYHGGEVLNAASSSAAPASRR